MELPASSAPGNERRPCGRAFPNRRVGRHEVRARALLVCNSCWRAYGTYNVAMRRPYTGEAERLQREGPGCSTFALRRVNYNTVLALSFSWSSH